jgi:hypothetical protein
MKRLHGQIFDTMSAGVASGFLYDSDLGFDVTPESQSAWDGMIKVSRLCSAVLHLTYDTVSKI